MKHVFLKGLQRAALLFLGLLLTGSSIALGQQPNIKKETERGSPAILKIFREVVAKPSESAVRVLCNGNEAALGAVIAADGLILTKSSLLRGDITCKFKDGRVLPAEILGEHDGYDLALLKVEAKGLVPVQWRTTQDLKQAMWLASVGPSAEPVAIGVVGVLTRKFQFGDQPPKTATAKSGYLGVSLENSDAGAKVKQIIKDSPAQKAGLKVDDIVLQAGSAKITDVDSFITVVQKHRAGDSLIVKVQRGKETLDIKTVLGKIPQAIVGNPQDFFGSELSDRRGGFPTILQHDTVLFPRDCGGPVVDLDGKTVGINISRAGRTETYAVPSEAVLGLLDDLKSGKLKKKIETKVDPKVAVPNGPFRPVETLRANGKLTNKDERDKERPKSFRHVYNVKLLAGAEYTIDLKSTAFDSYLRLEDGRGKQLDENDDGGGAPDARIVFRPSADGDYQVIVTTFQEGETGPYTLIVLQTGAVKK